TGSGRKLKILLRYFLTNYTNYQPMTITVSYGSWGRRAATTLESAAILCTWQIRAQYRVHIVATGRIPVECLTIASIEEQADRFGEVSGLAVPAVQRSVDALADRRTAVGRILHADRSVERQEALHELRVAVKRGPANRFPVVYAARER